MRIRTTILSLFFLLCTLSAGAGPLKGEREALNLYRQGLYSQARTLFEQAPSSPRTRAYALLCAIRSQASDYPSLLFDFRRDYPASAFDSEISFRHALVLFDQGEYAQAGNELGRVKEKDLVDADIPELLFKQAYCAYALGDYPAALRSFDALEQRGVSAYTAEARFVRGMMAYAGEDIATAKQWFQKVSGDGRFGALASYYVLECEFLDGNYAYVAQEGPAMYAAASGERRAHLARMLSESMLVLGEDSAARGYFDEYISSSTDMTRSDWFYAGSVLFASHDYKGALENYKNMTERTDSLGQIAEYNMAAACVALRNNVEALEHYKAAAQPAWRPDIREDAWFNYAKLSFDLNKSTEGFSSYIKEYGSAVRGEQIYSYMALSALIEKDYEGAIRAYDNIDELSPEMRRNYIKANYLRATQLAGSGSWRQAASYFKAASYYLPKNDRLGQLSRYWMAESLYHGGDYAAARGLFTELYNSSALAGSGEGRKLPYDIAYCYLQQKDWSTAAKWLEEYASDRKADYREDALTKRADCDFARKDYKAAVKSYQRVRDDYGASDKIYPYYRQGLAYGLLGEKAQKATALSPVLSASADAPLYSEALYELASTWSDLGRYPEAQRAFEKLCAQTRDSSFVAKGRLGLGMACRNAGDDLKAIEHYRAVVRAYPGTEYSESALMAVESIYRARKEPEKYLAFVEQEKTAAQEVDRAQMYFNTAEQVFLNGNYPQAIVLFQKYIDEWKDAAQVALAHFYIAESRRQLNLGEDACDSYAKALTLAPDASFAENARVNYAALLFAMERYDEAYAVYADLLRLSRFESNKTLAQLGLARSAYKARNWTAAVADAQLALDAGKADAAGVRELNYIKAKSLLALENRSEAFALLAQLAKEPATVQGAEAKYLLIQDRYDSGRFDGIADEVYAFAEQAPDQSYWLARAYIVLGDTFVAQGKSDFAKAIYESILEGYESGPEDGLREMVKRKLAAL